MIANHQLYLDWIYLWSLAGHLGLAGVVRIVLKRELLFFPVIGLGMKLMDFVFVSRKWEHDQAKFGKRIRRIADGSDSYCLLLFPEGTTLCRNTQDKLRLYATEKGIDHDALPKYTLMPRVTGLFTALDTLGSECEGVLDCTVGFVRVDPVREDPELTFGLKKLFVGGLAPPEVHIHLRYIPRESIPLKDKQSFQPWLRDRFAEKERLMRAFSERRRFPAAKYRPGRLGLLPCRS